MQYAAGIGSAVCCFAAAYGAHMIFPTKPIAEGDILLSQSTINTLNFIPIDKLREMKLPPRKLCQLYLDKKANLADVLMIVTNKPDFDSALTFLQTQPQSPENMFLLKAVHDNYPEKEMSLQTLLNPKVFTEQAAAPAPAAAAAAAPAPPQI